MSASDRTLLLACVVLGAVLAMLVMPGCATSPRQLPAMPMDCIGRDMQACDAVAEHSAHPGEAYELCMRERHQ